jgi:hypothetical protein
MGALIMSIAPMNRPPQPPHANYERLMTKAKEVPAASTMIARHTLALLSSLRARNRPYERTA